MHSLSHCGGKVSLDVLPEFKIIRGVQKLFQVGHGDSHVGCWSLEDLSVTDPVEGVDEVARRRHSVLIGLLCLGLSALCAIGVAHYALLLLSLGLALDRGIVVADVVDHVTTSRWKSQEA